MVTTQDLYALTEVPMDHEAFGVPTDAMVRGWEYGGGDLTRLFEDWYINVADLLAGERGNYRNPKEPK